MARTFRRNRQMHALSELNVTNLLDLAFVLLIIFMIATPLIPTREQTVPVNLPVESLSPQTPPPRDTKFVAITVRVDGTYFIDLDGNRALTARELPGRLRALAVAEGAKPPVIRIRGDAGVPYQHIITLMDELKKAGLNQVSFDTQTRG